MVKLSIQFDSAFGKSLIFQLLSVKDVNVVEVENIKDVFPSFLLKFHVLWLGALPRMCFGQAHLVRQSMKD